MIKKRFSSHGIFLLVLVLASLIIVIFRPLFFGGKIPFSANLLASFYNPWAQEKFLGWENGIPNKPIGIDDLRIIYPQRYFTQEVLKTGEIPFWDPYIFSGNYHFGEADTAVFYPLFWLFNVLPQINAWTFLIILQPILIAIGIYLYLRLILKNKYAVIFGSLVFAFSGVVIVRLEEGLVEGHTLLWLPFVFYGIEAFLQSRKTRYLFVVLLSMLFSLLSGWFQFAFYVIFFSFIYAVFRAFFIENKPNLKYIKRLIFLPFLLLPLISFYVTIPAFLTFLDSPRSINIQNILATHLMPLQHLLTFIFPDFWGNPASYNFFGISEYKESVLYIGFVPVILSIFSLFKFKLIKFIQFFSLAALVSLFLGINNPLSDFVLKLPIPIVSSFLPNRIFLISTFCLSILSAFGFEYLWSNYKNIKNKTLLRVFIPVGLLIVLVTLYVGFSLTISHFLSQLHLNFQLNFLLIKIRNFLWQIGLVSKNTQIIVQERNILLPDLLFLLLIIPFIFRKFISLRVFIIILFALTILGQVYFAHKYLAFSEPIFIFPPHPVFAYLQKNSGINRFISVGEGHITSDFPLMYNLFSADGVDAMYPKRYAELIRYFQTNGQEISVANRVETRIAPTSRELFLANSPYLMRFMQIDSVKYVVKLKYEKNKIGGLYTEGNDNFRLVWQNDKWQIFKFKDALPRIFWTAKYEVIKNDKSLLSRLFDEKLDQKTILLEKDTDFKTDANSAGNIQILEYSPNTIRLKVHSNGNGFVYLSDNFTPQFKAKVDGQPVEIFRADYSFRAIPVKTGDHSVILYYDSKGIELEFLVAAVSISIIFLGMLFLKSKKIISV